MDHWTKNKNKSVTDMYNEKSFFNVKTKVKLYDFMSQLQTLGIISNTS